MESFFGEEAAFLTLASLFAVDVDADEFFDTAFFDAAFLAGAAVAAGLLAAGCLAAAFGLDAAAFFPTALAEVPEVTFLVVLAVVLELTAVFFVALAD